MVVLAYLAPASPAELNIDHTMRAELISYMNDLPSEKEMIGKAGLTEGAGATLQASQLQTMVKLYERIQTYIFRLMATDSTPKVRHIVQHQVSIANLSRSVREDGESTH